MSLIYVDVVVDLLYECMSRSVISALTAAITCPVYTVALHFHYIISLVYIVRAPIDHMPM